MAAANLLELFMQREQRLTVSSIHICLNVVPHLSYASMI